MHRLSQLFLYIRYRKNSSSGVCMLGRPAEEGGPSFAVPTAEDYTVCVLLGFPSVERRCTVGMTLVSIYI